MQSGIRHTISLNGDWQIAPGSLEPPATWTARVPVPALVDVAVPAYDWQQHEYHWYRTTFRVDERDRTQLLFLKIEQAMFGTAVWLNGKYLGGDIGCYTSQEYDLAGCLRYGPENELLVRVGLRSTLPPESAVGNDQERTTFVPGIWGDVWLIGSGSPRIHYVQMIPNIGSSAVTARVTVENRTGADVVATLVTTIREGSSGRESSTEETTTVTLPANGEVTLTAEHVVDGARLWTPDHPFLYECVARVEAGAASTDALTTLFGMREFKISGGDFLLNGERIFLRGGNIALHRFFSDADRGVLPWDEEWIRKLLIDIPKNHHFNFFRNHIGQLYNRWYDIADEHGMLIQNEWCFWTASGTRDQILKEFTQWLRDNWNHPSIVIWDPLNESSDPVVQQDIIPLMKQLDPTRPWESVDFVEEHPYIFSLGPVLNTVKFGFTRALDEIENDARPTMLNEFLWWWIDKDGNPAPLTKDVVERWLGPRWTRDDLSRHQSFLAAELIELFRRMRVDAIQPFVYLSNNAGPTAHWFVGDIKDLRPKPLLQALKNVFEPFAVSLELWDRHFFPEEEREVRLFLLNDDPRARRATVRFGVQTIAGDWTGESIEAFAVPASGRLIHPVVIEFPSQPGAYTVTAELYPEGSSTPTSVSRKIAHVLAPPVAPETMPRIGICGSGSDVGKFLDEFEIPWGEYPGLGATPFDVIVAAEGQSRSSKFRDSIAGLTRWVKRGGTLIVLEPEFGSEGKEVMPLLEDLRLTIERRADADRGGYDSYLFAGNPAHPVWQGIHPDHLKMFNGAIGGEAVSQHDIVIDLPAEVHACCGLKLATAVLQEIRVGAGRVIISRLQTRGRLLVAGGRDQLFARRVDPVAQRYMLNLLTAFCRR